MLPQKRRGEHHESTQDRKRSRNRRSAQLHRSRQKGYIKGLERLCAALTAERDALRATLDSAAMYPQSALGDVLGQMVLPRHAEELANPPPPPGGKSPHALVRAQLMERTVAGARGMLFEPQDTFVQNGLAFHGDEDGDGGSEEEEAAGMRSNGSHSLRSIAGIHLQFGTAASRIMRTVGASAATAAGSLGVQLQQASRNPSHGGQGAAVAGVGVGQAQLFRGVHAGEPAFRTSATMTHGLHPGNTGHQIHEQMQNAAQSSEWGSPEGAITLGSSERAGSSHGFQLAGHGAAPPQGVSLSGFGSSGRGLYASDGSTSHSLAHAASFGAHGPPSAIGAPRRQSARATAGGPETDSSNGSSLSPGLSGMPGISGRTTATHAIRGPDAAWSTLGGNTSTSVSVGSSTSAWQGRQAGHPSAVAFGTSGEMTSGAPQWAVRLRGQQLAGRGQERSLGSPVPNDGVPGELQAQASSHLKGKSTPDSAGQGRVMQVPQMDGFVPLTAIQRPGFPYVFTGPHRTGSYVAQGYVQSSGGRDGLEETLGQ